jgi:toxin ParE1/3/4
MKRVEISEPARNDIRYLRLWLSARAPGAAKRATETIMTAAQSLADFPERGRPTLEGIRERIVPFGSAGYILQYLVDADRVVISRVFHTLERR